MENLTESLNLFGRRIVLYDALKNKDALRKLMSKELGAIKEPFDVIVNDGPRRSATSAHEVRSEPTGPV